MAPQELKNHSCSCETTEQSRSKTSKPTSFLQTWGTLVFCFLMLVTGMLMDHYKVSFFTGWLRVSWYVASYLPVAIPILKKGLSLIIKGEVFTEFFLMGIATLGAFFIGEYPEAVAVMLFYELGERFQGMAVRKAKRNIQSLLDIRPEIASVNRNGEWKTVHPEEVLLDEVIQVRPGEKVPLDGRVIDKGSRFDTSALTGESKPKKLGKGEDVLAGMVNLERRFTMTVHKKYNDSSISKILEMVSAASSRKAQTEQFIRKFAKVYTPIVTYLALALVILPYFFVSNYVFSDWLYRALVFLVISCPCALVVSIPLGYFGGIGAASKNGILFKGSNFLDRMQNIQTLAMDKTGTLTKGVFKIQEISPESANTEWISLAASLEKHSTHPVGKAILEYTAEHSIETFPVNEMEEISGKGLRGKVNGKEVLVGNSKLFSGNQITIPKQTTSSKTSTIYVAIDGQYAGQINIADSLKEDAKSSIQLLRRKGISEIVMLSGDKSDVTIEYAKELGLDKAYGDLLPQDKVKRVETLKGNGKHTVAFVGDGINDAPVLALADIGIAMGGLGSDVAIETADVVIQTDQPSKIAQAIDISKKTKSIVWQNIGLAFLTKLIVLSLGALGMATMWAAVFADVGVAMLAILNAIRIQHMDFSLKIVDK